jgi:hypothetical protein
MKRLLLVSVTTLALAGARGGQTTIDRPAQPALWASVAVSEPIFREGNTANLRVSFAMVNDGASALNPRIGSSHLLIDGVEPADWPFLINNGIRSLTHDWLPPGRFLQFAYDLGILPEAGSVRPAMVWCGLQGAHDHLQGDAATGIPAPRQGRDEITPSNSGRQIPSARGTKRCRQLFPQESHAARHLLHSQSVEQNRSFELILA